MGRPLRFIVRVSISRRANSTHSPYAWHLGDQEQVRSWLFSRGSPECRGHAVLPAGAVLLEKLQDFPVNAERDHFLGARNCRSLGRTFDRMGRGFLEYGFRRVTRGRSGSVINQGPYLVRNSCRSPRPVQTDAGSRISSRPFGRDNRHTRSRCVGRRGECHRLRGTLFWFSSSST